MLSKPNWIAIRNEYINGNISYRKIAEKRGVKFNTLKEIAIKEQWFEKRKEQHNKIKTKTEQKTIEKIATAEANRMARINAAADRLLEKIEQATEQIDMYLTKDKRRYKTTVIDKKTREPIEVYVEEEVIKSAKSERIDKAGLTQITRALKDLKEIQFIKDEDKTQETPNINITISPATFEDIGGEDD